jgi:hypothetical protein
MFTPFYIISIQCRHGSPPEEYDRNVPWGTREMVYFRLKASGIEYDNKDRLKYLMGNPWCEFSDRLASLHERKQEFCDSSPAPSLPQIGCLHCGAIEEVMYVSFPCACFKTCKQHAMKTASGGKCKICKELYAGFKKQVP